MNRLAILLFIPALQPIFAGTHWIKLTSPHFEMYTTNGAGQGAKALATFERARLFFLENNPAKKAPDTPVRIIAFRSEGEFKPYRPVSGAFAYYLRGRKRDHIVMQDLGLATNRAAVHEYTHLIAEHADLKLPIWLNEGLAEVFSSLEPRGDQAMVGRPFEGHMMLLSREQWVDLDILTTVDRNSPYYSKKAQMQIFYAQSWLLTHMTFLDEKYREKFGVFLTEVSSGKSSAAAFSSIYGKNLDQVRKDLEIYFRKRTVAASLYNVKLEKRSLEPEVADLSSLASELALADLLASSRMNIARAKEQLDGLAAQNPQSAEVEESLGYLAWQNEDNGSAELHFAKAMELGSNEPELLYHYAMLIHQQESKLEVSIAALRKSIALKPEYHEALLLLAVQNMRAHHYGTALSNFAGLAKISREEAFTVYSGIAYCDLQLKSPKLAREMALRAKPFAKTDEERVRIDELIRHIDASTMRNGPETPVRGVTSPQMNPSAQQ